MQMYSRKCIASCGDHEPREINRYMGLLQLLFHTVNR